MNTATSHWLDIALVTIAVIASIVYAAYALGPKNFRNGFTRFVTKHFGLKAAKLFSGSSGCDNCGGIVKNPRPKFFTGKPKI